MRWGLLGALLFTVIGAGCGGGGTFSLDPVASAADHTLAKQTGRFELNVTLNPQLGATTITGVGMFSNPKQAVEMLMNVPSIGAASAGTFELRLLYPVMYVRVAGLPAATPLPDGKTWMKLDLEQASKKLGVNLPQLELGANDSPTDALTRLRGSKHAKKLGTSTVGGVRATHYRVRIRIADALARATSKQREALQRLLQQAKQQGTSVAPKLDVWISDDGLVRRISEKLGRLGNATMTFSDYGAPVHIDAPPSDETYDLSMLFGSG